METQGTFRIAEPCHENWNGMTAEAQGRFCASCQRCVIDFTQKSPAEMKAIYELENGDVCGRVRVSQVATPRTAVRATIERYRMQGLKAIQMFALALLTAFSFHLQAEAQTQLPVVMGKVAYVPERVGEGQLSGRVVNEEGEVMKDASVWVMQDGREVATAKTDAHGTYTFRKLQAGEYEISASAGHGDGSIIVNHGPRTEKVADIVIAELRMMGQMIYIPEDTIEQVEIMEDITPEIVPDLPLLPYPPNTENLTPEEAAEAKLLMGAPIDLAGSSIRAFPNPTTDHVTLTLENGSIERLDLELYNLEGQKVYAGTWLPTAQPAFNIDLQALSGGIYILRMQDGDHVEHRQFLKR